MAPRLQQTQTALSPGGKSFQVDQLASTFIQKGLSASDALRHAEAQVYQQAQLLAFLDDFRWLALAFLVLLPLVLLLKPLRRGNVEPVHH